MPTVETHQRDITQTRVVEDTRRELEDGQSRLRVDAFGLTTNNITYAVFGDMLGYWQLFPSGDTSGDWGRVPAWGFAEVTESRSDLLDVGERLFGMLPMSDELVITPGRSDERGLTDVAEHRAGVFGTYNRYTRAATDPIWRADRERHQMLLYPLFVTGFVIDDFLADQGDFGAEQIVISSASSKTALGVAHAAHRRDATVVGLTSDSNQEMVRQLGVYDEVLTYDDVTELNRVPSVFVDIAGNANVVHAVHHHLDGMLRHSMIVGNTNWNRTSDLPDELPDPKPEFFFAPTQIAKRTKEWGADGLSERMSAGWAAFADWADDWLVFEHVVGADQLVRAWDDLAAGRADPQVGFIGSMRDTPGGS